MIGNEFFRHCLAQCKIYIVFNRCLTARPCHYDAEIKQVKYTNMTKTQHSVYLTKYIPYVLTVLSIPDGFP